MKLTPCVSGVQWPKEGGSSKRAGLSHTSFKKEIFFNFSILDFVTFRQKQFHSSTTTLQYDGSGLNIIQILFQSRNLLNERSDLNIILSDPPCKEGNARFTMVPLKPLTFHRVKEFSCIPLSRGLYFLPLFKSVLVDYYRYV